MPYYVECRLALLKCGKGMRAIGFWPVPDVPTDGAVCLIAEAIHFAGEAWADRWVRVVGGPARFGHKIQMVELTGGLDAQVRDHNSRYSPSDRRRFMECDYWNWLVREVESRE